MQYRVVKEKKRIVTLMFLPCVSGGDFKKENRRSRSKRVDVLLALEMGGFCGTFLGRCLGSSSGCARRKASGILC